jgi:hypothetical protein
MKNKVNAIQFFMVISIVCILIAGSQMRINLDLSESMAVYKWMNDSPSSNSRTDFPFKKPLCSLTGQRITFWRSMAFKTEFLERKKWLFAHDGAFEINKNVISFMWYSNEDITETELSLPDRGRFWKSKSMGYFVYYYGNNYSNLYCSSLETINQR